MNASPDQYSLAEKRAGTWRTGMREMNIAQLLARGLVKTYRLTLSPLIGSNCRHLPTCSQYADEAFSCHGFWAGGWMTLARLLRCHPLGTSGLDFVPDTLPSNARWYSPWRYGRWRGTNTVPPRRNDDRAC